MNYIEWVQQVAASWDVELSDEEAEALLWDETPFPVVLGAPDLQTYLDRFFYRRHHEEGRELGDDLVRAGLDPVSPVEARRTEVPDHQFAARAPVHRGGEPVASRADGDDDRRPLTVDDYRRTLIGIIDGTTVLTSALDPSTVYDAALTVLVTRGWVEPGAHPFTRTPPGGDLAYQQNLRRMALRHRLEDNLGPARRRRR